MKRRRRSNTTVRTCFGACALHTYSKGDGGGEVHMAAVGHCNQRECVRSVHTGDPDTVAQVPLRDCFYASGSPHGDPCGTASTRPNALGTPPLCAIPLCYSSALVSSARTASVALSSLLRFPLHLHCVTAVTATYCTAAVAYAVRCVGRYSVGCVVGFVVGYIVTRVSIMGTPR